MQRPKTEAAPAPFMAGDERKPPEGAVMRRYGVEGVEVDVDAPVHGVLDL